MTHENPNKDNKYGTAFRSSFWFVVILAGLFIAAVNFVDVMGHDEESEHGSGHTTEAVHGGATHEEATSNQTMEGETGLGKPAEHSTQGPATGTDSTHMEGH
jgi:hypothetical protein